MNAETIDLNADAGESFGVWSLGHDAALLDWVTTVNVACGFHAGDPLTMQNTLRLATSKNVAVGAHPGYPDLLGFGRRKLEATPEQVYADVLYQIGALAAFARLAGVPLRHVKAHGALSNHACVHPETASALAQATNDLGLPLVVLPGTCLEFEAQKLNMPIVTEAFPERAYLKNGLLAPRHLPNSSIHDPKEAARRAVLIATQGRVPALDGGWFELRVQSLCVHGDNPNATAIAHHIHEALLAEGLRVQAV